MGSFFKQRNKKYGNIFKTHIIGSPSISVAGPEYIKAILAGDSDNIGETHAKNVLELLGPLSITALQGPKHKAIRQQTLCAFKKKHLQQCIPYIYLIMEQHLGIWCDENSVLVYKRMKFLAFDAAWHVMFGMPLKQSDLHNVVEKFEVFIQGLFSAPFNFPGFPYYKVIVYESF